MPEKITLQELSSKNNLSVNKFIDLLFRKNILRVDKRSFSGYSINYIPIELEDDFILSENLVEYIEEKLENIY